MSSAPIISGMRKFPKAAMSTGIATQKIITEPWLVTSALYSVGDTVPYRGTLIPGNASCRRNAYTKKPPNTAMNMPVSRYCMAMYLWSSGKIYFSMNAGSWWCSCPCSSWPCSTVG